MKHLNIRVKGRVQGVFFRAATKKEADELDVRGFVQNEPDGTVYAEAEAEDDSLLSFLEWLKKGPPGAGVEEVSAEESDVKNFPTFDVRH